MSPVWPVPRPRARRPGPFHSTSRSLISKPPLKLDARPLARTLPISSTITGTEVRACPLASNRIWQANNPWAQRCGSRTGQALLPPTSYLESQPLLLPPLVSSQIERCHRRRPDRCDTASSLRRRQSVAICLNLLPYWSRLLIEPCSERPEPRDSFMTYNSYHISNSISYSGLEQSI